MFNKTKAILAIVALIVVIGSIVVAIVIKHSTSKPLSANPFESEIYQSDNSINNSIGVDEQSGLPMELSWNGNTYTRNSNISTFLFLGIDSDNHVTSSYGDGINGYATYIMLFILDRSTNTIDIVKFPDTLLTDVNVYDIDRHSLGNELLPLGSQYSFGDSNSRSNLLMRNKLSELLLGTNIDYCFALTLDGIQNVVNSFGTIDVVLRNNWTDIDSSYEVDTTVTLDSYEIMEFFNLRDSDENVNLAYLDRYDWFMLSLFNSVVRQGSNDVDTLMDVAGDGLETDISADTVADLRDFDLDETRVLLDISDEEVLMEFLITYFYNQM